MRKFICGLDLFLAFVVFTMALGTCGNAHALEYTPYFDLECPAEVHPNETDHQRFRQAGARSWEIRAWEAIRSGNIGKGPLDVLQWDNGQTDLGYFHLTYSQDDDDVLGLGISTDRKDWLDWATAALYWDMTHYDYGIQLREWRGRVGTAVQQARAAECGQDCLIVTAALANTSPTRTREMGEETGWDAAGMLDLYANGSSGHRSRRADFLRGELGL